MVAQYVNVSELQFTEGFLSRYGIFIRIKIQSSLKEVILGNGRHVSKHLSLEGSKILKILRKKANEYAYLCHRQYHIN